MNEKIGQIYLLGDLLKKSSSLLRQQEANELRAKGYDVYWAGEDKQINDKHAQTVESNNRLHERIVTKDTEAIMKSKTIVAGIDESSIGSICEMGQIEMFNRLWDEMEFFLTNCSSDELVVANLRAWLMRNPRKQVLVHVDDIRCTQLEEKGMNRSYSINQYLRGICVNAMNHAGACAMDEGIKDVMSWEQVLTELEKMEK